MKMRVLRSSTRIMRSQTARGEAEVHLELQERSGGAGLPLAREQNGKDQQKGSNHDGAVRNVERRPVVVSKIEIKEVGHRAFAEPVPQIAESSAQNQAQRNGSEIQHRPVLPEQ